MTLIELFTAIANAIRAKTGSSETITPTDFANQIDGIPTGITPVGEINIIENGKYDVSNYADANVNVSSTGGGKNVQYDNQMRVTTYAGYTKGLQLTVNKTGTYKVTRFLRRGGTSGTWGSQLYINSKAYGTPNTDWELDYYVNYKENPSHSVEYQIIIEEHVSLQEGDIISTYGRSNGNGNWLYHMLLIIEEE